jgi:hypothetical protein
MEKGSTETFVSMPFRVGRKMIPVGGPVADQFSLPGGRGSGKIVDPGIDPSDCINSIRTIRGNLVTNKKILRHRFIHPFSKPIFFFNRPSVIADFPDLIGGIMECLTEAWDRT